MKNKCWVFLPLFLLLPSFLFPVEKKVFTLDDIIQMGLENNPLLSATKWESEAKKAAYQASKRLVNPEFSYRRGEAKSYDKTVERKTEGFSISQYLENPFKRHHRIQWHEMDWASSEYRQKSFSLEIINEIKKFFYRILLLTQQRAFAQKNLASIQEIHRLIEKRAKLGEVKELEAIKLYVETLKAQAELNRLQTELILAKENLNKFLGNALPSPFDLKGRLLHSPLQLNEAALLNKALEKHPRIKEKTTKLSQAKSRLSYVKWQRLPDFRLSGFSHKELDGRNTGIGLSLDIPLWNFRSKEINEAENLYWKEKVSLKALKMEISTRIKSTLSQLKLSEQNLNIFHQGLLKQAEESLKISKISYTEGEISLIDYLDSQRTYYSILNDYQESLYRWNADKAALEKAIGEELK
jgi:cobalt-zinc-cadmium efflux system outer membrane protein